MYHNLFSISFTPHYYRYYYTTTWYTTTFPSLNTFLLFRIESPATLGRKCWAFAYLKQQWTVRLQQKIQTKLNNTLNHFSTTYHNAIELREILAYFGRYYLSFLPTFDTHFCLQYRLLYVKYFRLTMPLCTHVMANCFVNASYMPLTRNGTCINKINAFYTGFQWENGVRNNMIHYVFPKYNQTLEVRN